MKGRASRLALSAMLVTLAALQLGAAGVDFHAILQQLNKVMRKGVDVSAPTPAVNLYPVPIGKPGQRIDLSIPGEDFANNAMVYRSSTTSRRRWSRRRASRPPSRSRPRSGRDPSPASW